MEVAVVGDIQLESLMPLVERYLGSLPKRNHSAEHLDKLRRLGRPPGPLERAVKVETVTPQAMTLAGFIGSPGTNTAGGRALQLAANILSSRMIKRIREDLSLVYSIHAHSTPSWVYEDSGRFTAGAPCDPGNVNKVTEEIHKMFKEFADTGPTAEELSNAKKQIANSLDTELREPSYWWSLLQYHDLHHRDLNATKNIKASYAAFTGEEVQLAFKKYYTPSRAFTVTAVPAAPLVKQGEKPVAQAQ